MESVLSRIPLSSSVDKSHTESVMYGILLAVFGWFVCSSTGFYMNLYQAKPAVNSLTEYGMSHTFPLQVLCAMVCHKSVSLYEGFSYNVLTNICTLYNRVCLLDIETEITTGNHSIFVRDERACKLSTTLALDKPASMSSTYVSTPHPADASKGNDGKVPTTNSDEISFRFHTMNEQNPWWRCDITHICLVRSVYFMNRGWSVYNNQDYWARTRNIMVTVSILEADVMYNGGDNECGFIAGTAQRFDNLVDCTLPMIGQFVQLQMNDTGILNLYEVEVYGYTPNP